MVMRWSKGLVSVVYTMLVVGLTGISLSEPASAQRKNILSRDNLVKSNENTVGIISGKSDSAYLAAVEDMSAVLDDGANLRVIAMIGKGALQNIQDILFLRNTDMGVTQAGVLSYLKRNGGEDARLSSRIRYITKLFNEEVHIIAGKDVADLRALEGQTVNFGELGSGTQLSAELIFGALGITVKPVYMVQSDALVAIRRKKIAATVLVAGKPSPLLGVFRIKGGLKLLPIPYEEALEEDYLPAKITSADYPALLDEGEAVETIAMPAVLAVFNWNKGTQRYRRVENFVNAFFDNFDKFRAEARHPKWREVNLSAKLPGWQRFDAAQEWLDKNATRISGAPRSRSAPPRAAAAGNVEQGTFLQFLASQGNGGAPAIGAESQEALFRKFLSWMKEQRGGGAPAATATAGTPQPGGPPATTGSTTPPKKGRLW